MSNQMCICECGLDEDRDSVFNGKNSNKSLVDYANEYRQKLELDNIEIFEQVDNILITEKGYYVALFSNDLIKK